MREQPYRFRGVVIVQKYRKSGRNIADSGETDSAPNIPTFEAKFPGGI